MPLFSFVVNAWRRLFDEVLARSGSEPGGSRFFRVWMFGGLILLAGSARGVETDPSQEARRVLEEILRNGDRWVRVHAAEVLIKFGEAKEVADVFDAEVAAHESESPYRIGIWRVLAATKPAERAHWHARIVQAFLDPKATDRLSALESLAKLGGDNSPDTLAAVRDWADQRSEAESAFAHWLLWNSGDGGRLDRVVSLLGSKDPAARLRAAYILRWIRCGRPDALRALAAAAAAEPSATAARPYMIGAAYALRANLSGENVLREQLDEMIRHGETGAKYESLQAIAVRGTRVDLTWLEPIMRGDNPPDARIAAAWAVLAIRQREPAAFSASSQPSGR